jgi:hypothetical protein
MVAAHSDSRRAHLDQLRRNRAWRGLCHGPMGSQPGLIPRPMFFASREMEPIPVSAGLDHRLFGPVNLIFFLF